MVLKSPKWATNADLKCRQIYGQRLKEGIQGPGEAIFLPHGLVHAVLNVMDNVAVTENYLYVEGLPGLNRFTGRLRLV